MKKESLISIIVPVYKVEPYIHRCVDSILKQTYKNLEIILVDDGSPDDCGKICDEFAKKDLRVKVVHKENGGLSSARNAGLDIAQGEYISFIDSDDYIVENFIENLYKLCMDNNVEIAECDFEKFEDDIEKKNNIEEVVNIYSSDEMQKRLYDEAYVRTIVVWNKLYKKNIYSDLRFPLGRIHEDEYTTYKAFYKCNTNIAVTNLKLYYYRTHSGSIMGQKFNPKRLDALEGLRERKEFYKNLKEQDLYLKTLINYDGMLKKFYYITKENINESEIYLRDILYKAKENYNEIKNMKEISRFYKIKSKLFISSPSLYNRIRNIRILKK